MKRFGATRPVGEPLPLFPRSFGKFEWPEGYRAVWLDCGTSALAVAVRALVLGCDHSSPAIVLPAYTCPDVVSAVIWAGARPILLDTQPGLPWLDESSLQRLRDDSWVGVIAPHFLGLRHPMTSLRDWCRGQGLGLIEDSAQLSPRSSAFKPVGEFVVLSFGHGKPIPAGGGVLLFQQNHEAAVRGVIGRLPEKAGSALSWHLRALRHDMAITRTGYGLARAIPSLHVGETRYKPLHAPGVLGSEWARLAEAVIAGWPAIQDDLPFRIEQAISGLGHVSLPKVCGRADGQPLLRFPILATSAGERERIFAHAARAAAGVSRMYGKVLSELEDMPPVDMVEEPDNARAFASRLLTLPVHTGISTRDVALLRTVLADMQVGT